MDDSHSTSSTSTVAAPRLLVVDDQWEVVVSFRDYFDSLGYVVDTALDGMTALDLVARTPPDVVLLDLYMPKMDGVEVCRRLKADPHYTDIGVLLMTAFDEPRLRLEGLSSGADDYVPKPFSLDELALRVALQVRATTARRELKTSLAREQQKGVELAVHTELLAALNATRDIQTLCKATSAQIARLVPHDGLTVTQYHPETNTVSFLYVETPDDAVHPNATYPADQMPYTMEALRRGVPTVVDDVLANSHPSQTIIQRFRNQGIRSVLHAPLQHRDRTIGVFILISHRVGAFTPVHMKLVQQIMPHLALAVAQAEQYEALQRTHETIVRTEREKAALDTALQTGLTLSHEINNPLTAIIGFSELLYRENPDRPEYRLIMEAGQRIADVVQRLNQLKFIRVKTYLADVPIPMIDLGLSVAGEKKRDE
ncbi:MAG: response regulator [Candidatus Latescibacteria bacterium]|nr:response regulator [Candidatus Latescibacterota bacterium]